MLIESLKPLRVHLRGSAVELIPGQQIELPDHDGLRLLAKAPNAVRQILNSSDAEKPCKPIDIIPAAADAKQAYWETGTGQILGPAIPEFLIRDGDSFWIVTTFEAQLRWINADRLRSKKAFETQRAVHEVELIREF